MLQNLEKGGYNRLSRRQVLQMLGVGIGAIAMSGCTYKLLEPMGEASSYNSVALSTSATVLFPRTIQANANLNKRYLVARHQELKRIVRLLKRGQGNPTQLANRARRISHEIVDHAAERGLLRALDEDLIEVLTTVPTSLVLPLPWMQATARRVQRELSLSETELQAWERQMRWENSRLLLAIQQEGSERLWRMWLDQDFSVSSSRVTNFAPLDYKFTPLPAPIPFLVRVLIQVIVFVVAWDQPIGPGGECVPAPCPGQTPTPPQPPPPGCFVKGTLVATAQGLRPIEQVQAGDVIYAFDLRVQDLVRQKVIETYEVQGEEIFVLNFDAEKIRCTPSHRFYTYPGQWTPAKELKHGDKVLSLEGSWKELKEIRREVQPQPVFNLHVDRAHNYFAGGVLSSEYKTP